MSRRLVSASLVALMLGGCTGNTATPTPAQKPVAAVPSANAAAPPKEAPTPSAGAFESSQLPKTPDGLAAATTAYAQLVQQITPPPAQSASATQPIVVVAEPAPLALHMPMLPDPATLKWLDGGEFKLTLGPDQAEPPAPSPQADPVIRISGPESRPATPEPIAVSDDLEQQLTRRIKENPKDIAAQLDYQLFQFIRGRAVPQLDAINALDAEDREVLSALLDAISNFRSNVRAGGTMLLAGKVQPLIELQQRLAGTNLRVSNIALCRKVDGFGMYDRIAADRFEPHRAQQIIVYCEVENFSSQFLNESRLWETHLSEELVIYDATGRQVWIDRRQKTKDTCRTRRKDFSLAKMVFLPPLPLGRYTLTVSVQDEQAQRLAEASLPFAIGIPDTAVAR